MYMHKAPVQDLLSCGSFHEIQSCLLELIQNNHEWRAERCINLVAAEGPMSKLARSMLACDLSMRTANRYFLATRFIDQIEALCHGLITKLFNCGYCDPRLLGGTQACQVVYSALLKPGDTIISVMPMHGGDSSNCAQSMPGLLGLNIIPMPFLMDNITIDLIKLEQLVLQHRPAMICIGFSVSLFEPPLAAIKSMLMHTNTKLFYDAAHELGLIAGKCFADPFQLGVDIVAGSTGKTLSGPQGGLLLWNNAELTLPVTSMVFPNFVGSYQLNRIVALTITALEILQFGEAYMQQLQKNAKALAHHLDEFGLTVFAKQRNYTETHQVLINAESFGGGFTAGKRLESCNLIANHVNLPGDDPNYHPQVRGLRFATTEMTRRGMQETDMRSIAQLICRSLTTTEPAQQIATEASELAHGFDSILYC